MKRILLRLLLLFIILISTYSVLLVLVFVPNTETLTNNINQAIALIYEEGERRAPVIAYGGKTGIEIDERLENADFSSIKGIISFWHHSSGENRLDSNTDREIINKARGLYGDNPDNSPIVKAFSGYETYWHGYLVFLRPLLMLFDYGTIRYISLFHMTFLIVGICVLLARRLNMAYSLLFGFVLSMCAYNIIPYSLQYSSVFYVLFYAMLAILIFHDKLLVSQSFRNNSLLIYFFFMIGSVVNFVDFLTSPLLTLGIPLTLCYTIRNSKTCFTFKNNFLFVFVCSACWGAGYALTWIAKWVISFFISASDVVYGVTISIARHLISTEEKPVNLVYIFGSNIIRMYPFVLILVITLLVLVLAWLIHKKGKPREHITNTLPILLVCLFPYAWFMVFTQHSQYHGAFTYRIQAMSIFALGAFLLNCLPDGFQIRDVIGIRKKEHGHASTR
jgi:hypothetical protein